MAASCAGWRVGRGGRSARSPLPAQERVACQLSRRRAPADEDPELLSPHAAVLHRRRSPPSIRLPKRRCCLHPSFDTCTYPSHFISLRLIPSPPPRWQCFTAACIPSPCVFFFFFSLMISLLIFFLRLIWIISIPMSHSLKSLQFHRYQVPHYAVGTILYQVPACAVLCCFGCRGATLVTRYRARDTEEESDRYCASVTWY